MIIDILKTEKSMNDISNNKIYFIVDIRATKPQIREYLEKVFNIKVESIRTHINMRGQKIAIVKLAKDQNAQEILDRLTIG
ncbi:MAG: 50S ribosomal protein L23 [Candidatus Micrarchaeota archaeon]|nr:50S ribosomal protein L23 [Candidatus Micrarchaeota archaeon]MCX8154670.1 50S ribosomal protein L23 [Candidatus Micrarchaeota archaeon]